MHDIFYFTDIHGQRQLFDAIMNYCKEQDDEATIIFGGDACDRGTDGYAIMKELLNNPRVIYLKGNHEDIFVKAAREIKEKFNFQDITVDNIYRTLNACRYFDDKYPSIQISLVNGGLNTLTDWILDGEPMDIIERIEKLPLTFVYDNMDFCHAGGTYRCFKKVNEKEYNNEKIEEWDIMFLLWSRSSINMGWEPDRICIFGHTPTSFLPDYLENFKWPEDCDIMPIMYEWDASKQKPGCKLDMDTGAIFTGRAYVLNCLTMKAQGFYFNKESNTIEKIEIIQF